MNDLIDKVIRSCVMSSHTMAKARFNNAKDTTELIAAAQEISDTLVMAVEYRVRDRIEELLVRRIEDDLNKGEVYVKVGGKLYEINPAE